MIVLPSRSHYFVVDNKPNRHLLCDKFQNHVWLIYQSLNVIQHGWTQRSETGAQDLLDNMVENMVQILLLGPLPNRFSRRSVRALMTKLKCMPQMRSLVAKCRNYFSFANKLSNDMIFPTIWYVRPAEAQISLRMRAV